MIKDIKNYTYESVKPGMQFEFVEYPDQHRGTIKIVDMEPVTERFGKPNRVITIKVKFDSGFKETRRIWFSDLENCYG